MDRLPLWCRKAGQGITPRYSPAGYSAPETARIGHPAAQTLCPAVAFFTDLPFDQYERPFARTFRSLGRGRDLSAIRSIGETGPAVCGLPSHDLPGDFYFAKSRNILAIGEVRWCFRFGHFIR